MAVGRSTSGGLALYPWRREAHGTRHIRWNLAIREEHDEIFTEVTKWDTKVVDGYAREGIYVTGSWLEKARWDMTSNSLEDSRPKEMFVIMPVINCKAGLQSEKEEANFYICPTYYVPTRRPHDIFPAQLRTRHPPAKWVLGGVALILDIGQ